MAKKDAVNPDRNVSPKNGFPKGRAIWCRLFKAEAMEEGNDPSFSCAILFKEGTNIKALRKGYEAAMNDKFPGKKPRKLSSPFIEDDEIAALAEDYDFIEEGDVILKLRRYESWGAPQVWDQKVEIVESPTEFYSGCWAVADVHFYGWERKSSAGISCRLNGIQKLRDDEPLGGGKVDTQGQFDRIETDDDDDDDDDDKRSSRKGRDKGSKRRRDVDDDLI